MHCSMSVDLTEPAQNFQSKLQCLLSTFHQSGAQGPARMAAIESDTARLSARQGRPWGAILTEPTGAPALSFADRVGPQLLRLLPCCFEKEKKARPTEYLPKYLGI